MAPPITRRTAAAGLLGAFAFPRLQAQDGAPFAGIPGTAIRFAALGEAMALLAADDTWMAAIGDFHRRAVVGSNAPVSREEFMRWNAAVARAWSLSEKQRWSAALDKLAPAWNALRIPLPQEVLLISTSGQESAGAAYTRANAVVMPQPRMPISDDRLMAHELWHVAARHAPALATRLYAEIGFQPVAPLAYPVQWQPIRIANPDAPAHAHAIRVRTDSGTPWVMPVTVAGRTQLRGGENFFHVLQIRLLEVVPGTGGAPTTAVMDGDGPVWHPANASYLEQLGGNTGYVIHPEETIADNIALLATGGPARNPALLGRLEAALKARP